MKKILLLGIILSAGCATLSAPPVDISEKDLDYVESWQIKEKKPLEIQMDGSVLKSVGSTVVTDGGRKSGLLILDSSNVTVVKCVLRKKNDGICAIRSDDGVFHAGPAFKLDLSVSGSVQTDPIASALYGGLIRQLAKDLVALEVSFTANDGKTYHLTLK